MSGKKVELLPYYCGLSKEVQLSPKSNELDASSIIP